MSNRLTRLWKNIRSRSNPNSAECRRYPKYAGTENWFTSYSAFSAWCHGSEGFGLLDPNGNFYALDKDLAILAGAVDCKAYGPHCVFLPAKLNAVVKMSYGSKDQLPGVTPYRDGRFRMQYRDIHGTKHHGGIFPTEQDAHNTWKATQARVLEDASTLATSLGLTKAAHMFRQAAIRFEEIDFNGV